MGLVAGMTYFLYFLATLCLENGMIGCEEIQLSPILCLSSLLSTCWVEVLENPVEATLSSIFSVSAFLLEVTPNWINSAPFRRPLSYLIWRACIIKRTIQNTSQQSPSDIFDDGMPLCLSQARLQEQGGR